MRAVEISGLTVELDGREVLRNVDMSVESGSLVAIIGPNGAGKTTLLRAILGIVKPTKGEIKIFGLKPSEAKKKGLIGYLPQLNPENPLPLTALEVVLLAGVSREKAFEALKMVGMENQARKSFWTLSGGQHQKVILARALAREPRLLLLDEPSTGVDTVSQRELYELLLRLKAQGKTIIFTSHDIGAVGSYADAVYCLNVRMYCHGPASKCLTPQNLRQLYGREVDVITHEH